MCIALTMLSCVDDFKIGTDALEKPPGLGLTLDSIFSSPDYSKQFLWDAYSTLYYGMPWEWSPRGNQMNMGTPEALCDTWQSYLSWDYCNRNMYSGKYGASDESQHSKYHYWYEGSWIGIRKAYIFLENIDRVPDLDSITKVRLKGEAKMIIACQYADMYRNFGGLPIITSTVVNTTFAQSEAPQIDRATAKETLKFIVDLCTDAEKMLPWSLPVDERATWDGRFTGAAAQGLKIRMLLFGASPLFNDVEPYYTEEACESNSGFHTWFGGKDPAMWTDVVNACGYFFDKNDADPNSGFSLCIDPAGWSDASGDYRRAYRNSYLTRGNTEMLISTRVYYSFAYNEAFNYFTTSAAVPTLEYLDMFGMSDGTAFNNSVWNDSVISPWIDPWADRDPRMYETCILNNQTYQDRTAETWLGGRERGLSKDNSSYLTGAGNYKFSLDKKMVSGKPAQWPYLRLAEIILSYAEAINESSANKIDAIQWVDQVRTRVGLQGLVASFPGTTWTTETLREAILRERACEFGRENVRWFDIIRWKRGGDFKKQLHGLLIKRFEDAAGKDIKPGQYKHLKFTLGKRYWQDSNDGTNNFSSKWYLSAFPRSETYKNYKLPQNPGW